MARVKFSVEVAEIVSVVNNNELDCSVVEMGIGSKFHMKLMMKLYQLDLNRMWLELDFRLRLVK